MYLCIVNCPDGTKWMGGYIGSQYDRCLVIDIVLLGFKSHNSALLHGSIARTNQQNDTTGHFVDPFMHWHHITHMTANTQISPMHRSRKFCQRSPILSTLF